MRVCPSVGSSIFRPSVSPFFSNREIDISDKSNKPANLQIWQIWQNLTKSDKSLCNSFLVPYFRHIFVRTNMFFNVSRYFNHKQNKIGPLMWGLSVIKQYIKPLHFYNNPVKLRAMPERAAWQRLSALIFLEQVINSGKQTGAANVKKVMTLIAPYPSFYFSFFLSSSLILTFIPGFDGRSALLSFPPPCFLCPPAFSYFQLEL